MFPAPLVARALLLMLVLAAAWNPPLPWRTPPLDLLVLVDASQSVAAAARDAAWRSVAQSARRLPPGSRVAVVRFAAQAVEELPWTAVELPAARALLDAGAPPQRGHLDDTHTDISAALEYALHLAAPGRNTRIALISDGRATRGSTGAALRHARDAGVPVHMLPLPQIHGADSWIESLEVPTRVGAGQTVPVLLALASHVETRGTVTLSVDGAPYTRREVALSPERSTRLRIDLPAPPTRSALLSVELQVAGDPEPRNDHSAQIINVAGVSRILYLTHRPAAPALARSLRAGGWDVALRDPHALPQAVAELDPTGIVLDDVAADDLPDTAWETLARRVTREGTGLLVLGGAHAFGAGGYRRSRLEDLLPVTAEARVPAPPAAVMFVLDTSGSMDRRDAGPSRLAVARRALLETARRLRPDDAVGLLEFAAEPHLALALGRHRDPAAALGAASQAAPTGGTRLAAALGDAVRALAAAEARQRLLILVTDGQVEQSGAGDLAGAIAQAGIDVIALAIGPDAQTAALLPLTRINRGRLLHVARVAELPALMRRELEQRRPPTEIGRFAPELGEPLPFLSRAADGLPALTSYAVTRERESAAVYLRVKGDPLLAAHYAGAGRVAVLTTGLDDWPGFWSRWPDSGGFAGGLLDWIDARHGADDLHIRAHPAGSAMTLVVDTPPAADVRDAEILVRGPDGRIERQALPAQAPGRYEARIATAVVGRYRAVLRVGDRQGEHDWIYGGNDEFMPPGAAAEPLADRLQNGLLQRWPIATPAVGPAPDGRRSLRAPLLYTALGLYSILLLWERRTGIRGSVARRLPRAFRSIGRGAQRSGAADAVRG